MSRPEHIAPPEIYYNQDEAKKYAGNTRVIEIQSRMSERAVDLLNLPADKSCLLLDIGCGSGLSGEVISDRGHTWVGLDISPSMLGVAKEREVEGDLFLHDMGQGMPFRAGTFDGAVSISAVQWLCNEDKSWHNAQRRITCFFQSLYSCLARGAKAIIQLYPETPQQMELITSCAMRCGFTGGLVIDFPNSSKAKKYFLCLCAGTAELNYRTPSARGVGLADGAAEENEDGDGGSNGGMRFEMGRVSPKRERRKGGRSRNVKDKDWILRKKDRARRQGKAVAHDSKYTARKRRPAF